MKLSKLNQNNQGKTIKQLNMKASDFDKSQDKDRIEITKQQQVKITRKFTDRITPKENHILFEINIVEKTIGLADFKPPNTLISWSQALEMYSKKKIKRIDIFNANTITKSEVIKNKDCIYISALNKKNAVKKLKRDFGILIEA